MTTDLLAPLAMLVALILFDAVALFFGADSRRAVTLKDTRRDI
jgi:hypothetical protein